MRYVTTINDKDYVVDVIDEHTLLVNGKRFTIDFDAITDQPVYSLLVDGQSHEAFVYPSDEGLQVLMHGILYPAVVEDERERRLRAASGSKVAEREEFLLKAPMPGLVVSIPVSEGQQVGKGEVLLVLESMKMQNELKSPRDGTVSRLRVSAGESVDQKQTLLSVV